MNNRILELAQQHISNVRFWDTDKDTYTVGQDELQRFADAIVQECISICDADYIRSGQAGAGWRLARQIEQQLSVIEKTKQGRI